jgi:hypothetical protein
MVTPKHSSSKSEAKNEWRMLTDEQVFSLLIVKL